MTKKRPRRTSGKRANPQAENAAAGKNSAPRTRAWRSRLKQDGFVEFRRIVPSAAVEEIGNLVDQYLHGLKIKSGDLVEYLEGQAAAFGKHLSVSCDVDRAPTAVEASVPSRNGCKIPEGNKGKAIATVDDQFKSGMEMLFGKAST